MGELLRRPVYHVQNERFAIDTPEVQQEFSKRNPILLKVDWTNGDPEITQILNQSRGLSRARQ
jgi:thiol:disulfide interchange protein